MIALTLEEAAGRRPVLAGTGSNDTEAVVARSRRAQELGASGMLSVGPYYNKPTPEGYYRHFAKVADALAIPVVVYNVPGRTGRNIDAATQLRLAAHGNVKAVKEASGNIAQVMEILHGRPAGFEVLSGDDALTLPFMALGADGVVSVVSNQLPREMHDLAAACRRGDFAAARGHPLPAAGADAAQLRRVEPHPGQDLAGADGPVRGELPAADVPAHRLHPGEAARRAAAAGAGRLR